MKLAGFNIKDINRRLTNLHNWLGQAELDIVCLQELKATDTGFPTEAVERRAITQFGAARTAGTA
jgi:exodeoxyribonuclease-3